jgi:ABC-2 type transporter
VTNVWLGIWNDDAGAQSAELVRRFADSPAFGVTGSFAAPEQARAALDAKTVAMVLHVPQNFSADVLAGRLVQAQLLLDARRSNSALMAQGYAAAITSPMIVLSGYAAPIENMPYVAELVSRADPIRYMLVAVRGLFLQDMPLAVVLSQAWPMALIAVATLTVAGFAVRRALS